MPELTDWLEAKFQASYELYKEHYTEHSHQMWESYLNRTAEMEQRIMAAIDDLTAAVNADVAGRKALAASVAEIGTAVTGVSAFLQNNPAPSSDVIANLAQQLSTAGSDLTTAAGSLHGSALTLEALVPAAPAPPAVGDTVSLPSDPADPSSPPADHTVTAVSADAGTITAQPVSGGDPVTVPAASVVAATS